MSTELSVNKTGVSRLPGEEGGERGVGGGEAIIEPWPWSNMAGKDEIGAHTCLTCPSACEQAGAWHPHGLRDWQETCLT